jgi:hypothetical protein
VIVLVSPALRLELDRLVLREGARHLFKICVEEQSAREGARDLFKNCVEEQSENVHADGW